MGEGKHGFRASALLQRESLSISEATVRSRHIQERALQFSPYTLCRSVVLYSPIGNEVATALIRDNAFTTGKKLFYPRLGIGNRETLDFIEVESTEEFKAGRYGILEPTGEKTITKQDKEGLVVFVPGLVFDCLGNRLGRGKGWYDRALKVLGDGPRIVALAYEIQILEKLPTNRWDRKVHYIITEKRIINCGEPLRQSGWFS